MRREERGEMKEVGSIIEHIQNISKNTIVKRIAEESILVLFLACIFNTALNVSHEEEKTEMAKDTVIPEHYVMLHSTSIEAEQEEIRNEIFYGEIEEVALIVQAESGNQDELGKRYVADVVWNRVDDKDFPDKPLDVIYQIDPIQFATTVNGAMGKAGYTITDDVFQIALEEQENRTNSEIVYFRTGKYSDSGTPAFKYGDHYFSTK